MHITANRDALAQALSTLSRIVERRNTIPILSNVLLAAGNGRLSLTATDLDIEAETSIEAETGAHEADVTLPAHMLNDIVRKLPAGAQLTMEATDNGRIALRSGRARFALSSLPAADFPEIAQTDFSHRFALPAKTLAAALAAVDFAISTEQVRYYLNGVFLHTVKIDGASKLAFVATDGHRLARWRMPAPQGADGMPGVIVPRKTALELARLARDAEGDATIEASANKLRVALGGFTLTSKVIDGTFPDYQRVIPASNDVRVTLRREDLAQAADRVATIASERGKAVKLEFAAGRLTLTVVNPETGDATEELPASYSAAPMQIGFNAAYLRDVLSTIGGEQSLLRLADAGSPALFSDPVDDALLVVLMPMRV